MRVMSISEQEIEVTAVLEFQWRTDPCDAGILEKRSARRESSDKLRTNEAMQELSAKHAQMKRILKAMVWLIQHQPDAIIWLTARSAEVRRFCICQ
eukprot:768710-Hanusia_phi.AAC.6